MGQPLHTYGALCVLAQTSSSNSGHPPLRQRRAHDAHRFLQPVPHRRLALQVVRWTHLFLDVMDVFAAVAAPVALELAGDARRVYAELPRHVRDRPPLHDAVLYRHPHLEGYAAVSLRLCRHGLTAFRGGGRSGRLD